MASSGKKPESEPTKYERFKEWRVWIFSAVYLIGFTVLVGPLDIWNFLYTETDLNEIGDFLAGVFAPLALIWLIVAVMTQRQELKEARDQAAQAQGVITKQLDSIDKQNQEAKDQSIRNYKLDLFEYRFEIFKQIGIIENNVRDEALYERHKAELEALAERSRYIFGQDIYERLHSSAELFMRVMELDQKHKHYQYNEEQVRWEYESKEEKDEHFNLVLDKEELLQEIEVSLHIVILRDIMEKYLRITDEDKEDIHIEID